MLLTKYVFDVDNNIIKYKNNVVEHDFNTLIALDTNSLTVTTKEHDIH